MYERKEKGTLYLVVPCYNEEEVIESSIEKLLDKLSRLVDQGKVTADSKIMFVNDGSKDNTLFLLHAAAKRENRISVLSFSTNFGHQSAILAGMLYSAKYASMVVTIDADLQQDIEALDQFIACYDRGCEIVYGVRNDRHSDSVFKKATASCYYRFLHWLGCSIITNHADYRLMSKRAIQILSQYQEVNLFLRGLVPTLGLPSDVVYFDVKKREAGTSKYTVKKMIHLATNGITSLSVRPLQIITIFSLLTCVFGVGMAIYCLIDWINGNTVPGYTTTLMVTLIMNGMTLLSLGIIGEYLGKLYMEAKKRPRYIVESFIWNGDENEQNGYSC